MKPAFFVVYAVALGLNMTFTRAWATHAGPGMAHEAVGDERESRGIGAVLRVHAGGGVDPGGLDPGGRVPHCLSECGAHGLTSLSAPQWGAIVCVCLHSIGRFTVEANRPMAED